MKFINVFPRRLARIKTPLLHRGVTGAKNQRYSSAVHTAAESLDSQGDGVWVSLCSPWKGRPTRSGIIKSKRRKSFLLSSHLNLKWISPRGCLLEYARSLRKRKLLRSFLQREVHGTFLTFSAFFKSNPVFALDYSRAAHYNEFSGFERFLSKILLIRRRFLYA